MTRPMKLTLHQTQTGYADKELRDQFAAGVEITSPFVLFTGQNGSGKSAILRGIRSTIGLSGERFGQACQVHGAIDTALQTTDRPDRHSIFSDRRRPSAVFDLEDLGWQGQSCYLFDSRAASEMGSKHSFDEGDMLYHVGLIAGGGNQVSHGQFVTKTWNEAIEWACGAPIESRNDMDWNDDRRHVRGQLTSNPSQERWLFLDEPEGAIDVERLIAGMAALLYAAQEGRLRVFCSSHSLLFASGLADHPKVQVINMKSDHGNDWMEVKKRALKAVQDRAWIDRVGKQINETIAQESRAYKSPTPRAKKTVSKARVRNKSELQAEKVYNNLPAAQRSAMTQRGKFSAAGLSRDTMKALERRKIMQDGRLTQLGRNVRAYARTLIKG